MILKIQHRKGRTIMATCLYLNEKLIYFITFWNMQ